MFDDTFEESQAHEAFISAWSEYVCNDVPGDDFIDTFDFILDGDRVVQIF